MYRINTTNGELGIKTNWGSVNIRQPQATINMDTELPKVEIRTTDPEIKIDQRQCFAEAGIKSPIDFSRENSDIAKKAAFQGIARIVQEGNQMADIHLGRDVIVENADHNAFGIFEREFVYGAIPKSRPKIDVKMGTLDIKFIEGKLNYSAKVNKPEITVNHGSVDIYMKTWPKIEIEYFGDKIDKKL